MSGWSDCPWCRAPRYGNVGCLRASIDQLNQEKAELAREIRDLIAELERYGREQAAQAKASRPEVVKRQRRPAPSVPARRQPVPIIPGGWR